MRHEDTRIEAPKLRSQFGDGGSGNPVPQSFKGLRWAEQFRVGASKEVINDLCLGFEQDIQLGGIPDFQCDASFSEPFPLLFNFRENLGRFKAEGRAESKASGSGCPFAIEE
jgi:hypothetical protein